CSSPSDTVSYKLNRTPRPGHSPAGEWGGSGIGFPSFARSTPMKRLGFLALALALLGVVAFAPLKNSKAEDKKAAKKVVVVMETSKGTIEIELNAEKAPITVKNFLAYVDDKFYDNTIFHRVISTFMVQGGGFTKELKEKKTKDPIKLEAGNGLSNV